MNLLTFLGVAVLVIVTPGQDTALTIRNVLVGGRRGGTFTALGVCVGQSVWAVATALGLAALLDSSRPAFDAIRLIGAAYLIFLGIQALVTSIRASQVEPLGPQQPIHHAGALRGFRQGLISNLANPKMAIFFITLLPQFTGAHASVVSILTLGLAFSSLTFLWLSTYSMLMGMVRAQLQKRAVVRAIHGVTGLALLGIGLRVATET